MAELLRAFSLGNAAILTNACMLPLYPGLIAFLAGRHTDDSSRRATGWLGLLVLAGILTMMTLVGLVLYLFNQSFGNALELLLPISYGVVILFGVLMLLDRSPFARLSMLQSPRLRSPYLTAYVYGLLFGPMTLPCTGPVILSAFALGAGNASELAQGLLFFVAFGLGFGWPLAVLPFFALAFQRRLVQSVSRHHLILVRGSGVLLIGIGVFGILTELLPHYLPIDAIALSPTAWGLYWFAVALTIVALATHTYRRQRLHAK
jgi:cytochrome c-type biogenesis protein